MRGKSGGESLPMLASKREPKVNAESAIGLETVLRSADR